MGRMRVRETNAAPVNPGGFGGKCSSPTGQTFPGSAMSVLQATLAKAFVLRCNTLHDSSMVVIWLPM